MKIILSPAKKMVTDTDSIAPVGMPNFLDKTTEILSWMKGLEKDKLKAIWKCNDKIARQNFERLENMDLYHMLTPAILSYEGIAFQYMAPAVFEYGQFEYIQNLIRILWKPKATGRCETISSGNAGKGYNRKYPEFV